MELVTDLDTSRVSVRQELTRHCQSVHLHRCVSTWHACIHRAHTPRAHVHMCVYVQTDTDTQFMFCFQCSREKLETFSGSEYTDTLVKIQQFRPERDCHSNNQSLGECGLWTLMPPVAVECIYQEPVHQQRICCAVVTLIYTLTKITIKQVTELLYFLVKLAN